MLPPMVIGEQLNHEWTRGEVPGRSVTSRMELFVKLLIKFFIKSIWSVVLLLDGHSFHYNLETVNIAAENEIIPFCLPPHMTHLAIGCQFFWPSKEALG